MRKYTVFSFIFLSAFLLIFNFLTSGIKFGLPEPLLLGFLILMPLLGLITGYKSEGWSKWVLVTLNGMILLLVTYAIAVSFTMPT